MKLCFKIFVSLFFLYIAIIIPRANAEETENYLIGADGYWHSGYENGPSEPVTLSEPSVLEDGSSSPAGEDFLRGADGYWHSGYDAGPSKPVTFSESSVLDEDSLAPAI